MGPEPLANDRLLARTCSGSGDYRGVVAMASYNATPMPAAEKANKQCSRKLNNNKHTALRRTSHCMDEAAKSAESTVNHRRKLYADEADVFERATQIVM